ncbi:MAG: TrmH family RNA methyltransferase [Acidimicrobiia bacterium]
MQDAIASLTNPKIKALIRLRTRRERDRTGMFLIEGNRELRRALEAGVNLEELYICSDLFSGKAEPLLVEAAAAAGAELVETAEAPFHKVAYRHRPHGLLAVARQFPTGLDRLDPAQRPLILVVEGIEKPGNLGTMLRTAEAGGADAVIVCDPTTDPFNPNVVRASLGTLFRVPLAIAATDDAQAWLRQRNITTFAATPDAPLPYWTADYQKATALAVGSEHYGLSGAWLRGADELVSIPMQGSVDSLNAAMAAGILLFEAARQRQDQAEA